MKAILALLLVCCATPRTEPSVVIAPRPEPSVTPNPKAVEQLTVFRSWEELPVAMQSRIAVSTFSKGLVVRLFVDVGCIGEQTKACASFGWPDYAKRCRRGSGAKHDVKFFETLDDVAAWPDGYTPPDDDPPAFSWKIRGEDHAFDLPTLVGCKTSINDEYWFAIRTADGPIEIAPYYGSNLCVCIDDSG